MNLLIRWFLSALAFLAISKILPGVHVDSIYTALILAFFWGIASVVIRPVLILLTLPITILTLGLFTLVINGFLFWLLSTFVKGFVVSGFGTAILGAMILSVIMWLVNMATEKSSVRNR